MAPTTATASRTTRSKTGNSKPRIFAEVEAPAIPTKKRSNKKKSTTKANTSKPRSKKTTTGRVAKPKTTTKKAPAKKEKTVKAKAESKINGAVEKLEGAVEGKPAKKVGSLAASISTETSATFQADAYDFTPSAAPAASTAATAGTVQLVTNDAPLSPSRVYAAPTATANSRSPSYAFVSCARAWRRLLLSTPRFS